jgi:hypothetical protein
MTKGSEVLVDVAVGSLRMARGPRPLPVTLSPLGPVWEMVARRGRRVCWWRGGQQILRSRRLRGGIDSTAQDDKEEGEELRDVAPGSLRMKTKGASRPEKERRVGPGIEGEGASLA